MPSPPQHTPHKLLNLCSPGDQTDIRLHSDPAQSSWKGDAPEAVRSAGFGQLGEHQHGVRKGIHCLRSQNVKICHWLMQMMNAKLMNWKYSLQGKGKWDGELSKSSFNFRWLDLTDLQMYYAWLIHFQLYPALVKVCSQLHNLKNT